MLERAAASLASLLLVSIAAPAVAQDALFQVAGTFTEDRCGYSVAGAGDIDGDGHADVIVGSPYDDDSGLDCGSARILSGIDGSTLHFLTGAKGDQFGYSVASAGDVDGDGFVDLVIGAPLAFQGRGYARIHSGPTAAVVHVFEGQVNGSWQGSAVAGLGDMDHDGRADVVVGASETSGMNGRVTVYSGMFGGVLWIGQGGSKDLFGWAVAGPGDTILDGYVDILVGAPGKPGSVQGAGSWTFSGQDGALLHHWPPQPSGDRSGWSVSAAGDADADGFADVLIGSPDADTLYGVDSGRVDLYSGISSLALRTWTGKAAKDQFGASVSGGHDLDGDGFPDVLAGAPGRDDAGADAGKLFVLSVASGETLYTVDGATPGDGFGDAAAWAGDVNGDGFADWIVGAPKADLGNYLVGEASVWSRPCGGISSSGAGCPGSGGFVPVLEVRGCPVGGAALSVSVDDGPGGASGVLFAGLAPASVPLDGGCTLLLQPALPVVTIPLAGSAPGTGTAEFSGTIPSGTLAAPLHLQFFAIDAGVPHGFCASNAVQFTVLPEAP